MYFSRSAMTTTTVTAHAKNSAGRIATAAAVWLLVALFANQGYGVSGQQNQQPMHQFLQHPQNPTQQQAQNVQQPQPPLFPTPLPSSMQPTPQQNQEPQIPLQQQMPPQQPQQQQMPPQQPQQQQMPPQQPQQPQQQQMPPQQQQSQQQQMSSQQQMPPQQPQQQKMPPLQQNQQQLTQQTLPPQQFQQQSPLPPQQFQQQPPSPPQQFQQQPPSLPQQFQQSASPQQSVPPPFQSQSQQQPQRPILMDPLNTNLQPPMTVNVDPSSRPIQQNGAITLPMNTAQYDMSGSLPQGITIGQPPLPDTSPSQQMLLQKQKRPQTFNNVQRPMLLQQPYGDQPTPNGYSVQSSDITAFSSADKFPPSKLGNVLPMDSMTAMLNPAPYVQQSAGLASGAIGKVQEYSTGLKNGVGNMALDVGFKVLDGSQSLVHGLANAATAIPDTLFDLKRKGMTSLGDLFGITRNAGGSAANANYAPPGSYYAGYGGYPPTATDGGVQGQTGGVQGQTGGSFQMGGGYPVQTGPPGYQGQTVAGYPVQTGPPGYQGQTGPPGYQGQTGPPGYQQTQFPVYPQQQQQQQQQQQLQQQQQQRPYNRYQNGMSNGQIPVTDTQPIRAYN